MANDAHEEFWGCTLTKDKKDFVWNPTETEDDIEHKLQVTSACLGHKVKEGERNLVELTTEDDDGRKITCSMVSLRAGDKECLHLELGFQNPTKFTLKEGNGPISLCGVHLQAVPIDFDENDTDSEDDEDIPNLVEPKISKKESQKVVEKKPEPKASPVKRPLEENQHKPAAKKKKPDPEPESEQDEDEADIDEDSEEEDSDEEMPSLLDGEAEEDDDEESEDEDEPEEGDEVDSEDEEDNEEGEDDEEESEEETPAKKTNKKLPNGHTTKEEQKKPEKTPQKTPAGKGAKKTATTTPKSAAGAKKTPEEIKAMLVKSPNLPKKFEKFANYMKNNMKVTDEKSQKEFWDYIQKNKK